MITDEEISKAFAGTNFGARHPRDVIAESLLKYACGYHTGRTARMICLELGLVNERASTHVPILSKKGREYLWESYKPI
jgi:hypothetical protein